MLIVNLYAGPGAGKSTLMALVFAELKRRGVCVEMAPEFAKELTWQKRFTAMACQPHVFGEQLWRLESMRGTGVQVAVTDSPLLLSTVDGKDWPDEFRAAVRAIVARQERLNFYVRRSGPYDPRGRRQSLESAEAVDADVLDVLMKSKEGFQTVWANPGDASHIANLACAKLKIEGYSYGF